MERRPQPGEIPAPPLPEPGDDLHVIHCSQERAEDCAAATPAISAIVVQNVRTCRQWSFAALHAAERRGIGPEEWPCHRDELERELLTRFFAFADGLAGATWLHWGMRGPLFGFELIAQRARRHGLEPLDGFPGREFDLANYLKRTYGRDFAPDPRLWHAIQRNELGSKGLLSEEQARAAWASGHYAHLLRSLCLKVHAIGRLYELARSGEFRIGGLQGEPPGIARSPMAVVPPTRDLAPPAPVLSAPQLATLLRRSGPKGKAMPANLVEFMADRDSAPEELVAEKVHGDRYATSKCISGNIGRTNRELERLAADFRFKLAAGHVHRIPAGAALSPNLDEKSPKGRRSVAVA